MKAEFEDEEQVNEGYLILFVTDNDGTEHEITFEKDSEEIVYHGQQEYPDDPSNRTSYEDEMVHQARMYAKWFVYHNTGYDTLDPVHNPDRIAATLVTIHSMDDDTFETYFGEFATQLRSHTDSSVTRPVSLAADVRDGQAIYNQDVYLDEDIDTLRGVSDDFADEIGNLAVDVLEDISLGDFLNTSLSTLTGSVKQRAAQRNIELPSYDVEEVSDLYYMYHRPNESPRTVGPDHTLDREPDTTIELPELSIDSTERFRAVVQRHLVCQIRDVYIGTGIEPPAPFRVIGPGLHKYSLKYKHFDMYEEYYDHHASIPGYTA